VCARLVHCARPRQHTDAMSEVLDLVAAPVYLYTITCTCYYGYTRLDDYHYGDRYVVWCFQRAFILFMYLQMMANWAAIRYVDTSILTAAKSSALDASTIEKIKWLNTNDISDKETDRNQHGNGDLKRRKGTKNNTKADSSQPLVKMSYWSWKPCDRCHVNAPPRCHHCPFCDTCILKRDHHCFFAGKCVGFVNQRYFVVFLFWSSFACIYAMLYFLPYFNNVVLTEHTKLECFLPITFVKFVLGDVDFYHFNLILSFTLTLMFVFLSTAFLLDQYTLINMGWIQFEQTKVDRRKLRICDPRPLGDKVKAVLGSRPLLTLVWPLTHDTFPPCDDPFNWPQHQITHHKVK